MKFYKVSMGNGWCGCDEEFVTKSEELTFEDCLEMYTYTDEYEDYDDYLEDIASYSDWKEISEEEFNFLIKEERWEER